MDVRQKLSLIPRPIVYLVPRRLRDRLRTWMLERERERERQSRGQRQAHPDSGGEDAALLPEVKTQLVRVGRRIDVVEDKVDGVLSRFDDLQKAIEQLDARISADASGDAPSVVDDLRELVAPIEELSRQLKSPNADTDVPVAETRHAAD